MGYRNAFIYGANCVKLPKSFCYVSFISYLWIKSQTFCKQRQFGGLNSRLRATSLFQWLVVGDKGTQKKWNNQIFSYIYSVESFRSKYISRVF